MSEVLDKVQTGRSIGNCVLGYVEVEYPGVLPRKEERVYFVE